MARPIIEPFRIKMVEPIRMTTPAERARILAAARYNLFGVRAEDVIVDERRAMGGDDARRRVVCRGA